MSTHMRFRSLLAASYAIGFLLIPGTLVPSQIEAWPTLPEAPALPQDEALSRWFLESAGGRLGFHAPASERLGGGEPQAFDGLHPLYRLPYGEAICSAAQRHQLDSTLLAAMVEAESGFDARVISPAGAVGLLQILPEMAQGKGDPFDPRVNLEVGARYFSDLLKQFGGHVDLALAAYNAGPGAVERYGAIPPYRETRSYVRKVLSLYGDRAKLPANAAAQPMG